MANPNQQQRSQTSQAAPKEPEKKPEGAVFTYVGSGSAPSRKVNIIGKQDFYLGKATEVTDAEVLAKVKHNPTFVEGEVSPEELVELHDKKAKREALVASRNAKLQAEEKKRNGAFAAKGEKDEGEE